MPPPSSAPILSLAAARSPVLTFEEHRQRPRAWSPLSRAGGGGGALLSPLISGEEGEQWGYWLLLHVREPAAAEPRWESGIINRSYRGLGKNAGLCGV